MKPRQVSPPLVYITRWPGLAHRNGIRQGVFGSIVGQTYNHSDSLRLHAYNIEAGFTGSRSLYVGVQLKGASELIPKR
jgi:hypothetical protein